MRILLFAKLVSLKRPSVVDYSFMHILSNRASVKLFELGVRTPGGLFLGVRYAGGVDFRRFCTPSLTISA